MVGKVAAEFRSKYKVRVIVSPEQIVWHDGADPSRIALDDVANVEIKQTQDRSLRPTWWVIIMRYDASSAATPFRSQQDAQAMADAISDARQRRSFGGAYHPHQADGTDAMG